MIEPMYINKYQTLSDKNKSIIDDMIKNNYSVKETCKIYNISYEYFHKILNLYSITDSTILDKYKESIKLSRSNSNLKSRMNSNTHNTNLYKIKVEKNLTTKQLSDLSKVSTNVINLLVEGKNHNPKITTLFKISEALNVPAYEVFPEFFSKN